MKKLLVCSVLMCSAALANPILQEVDAIVNGDVITMLVPCSHTNKYTYLVRTIEDSGLKFLFTSTTNSAQCV